MFRRRPLLIFFVANISMSVLALVVTASLKATGESLTAVSWFNAALFWVWVWVQLGVFICIMRALHEIGSEISLLRKELIVRAPPE